MEGDVITMQEIFVFEKAGITRKEKSSGASGQPVSDRSALRSFGGRHRAAAGDVRRRYGGAVMLCVPSSPFSS